MKLSIVVSIHNMEHCLSNCILSIINNTNISDFEILLINGNSTDNSEEICLGFQCNYDNIKYFKLQESASSEIKNKGLAESSGEYIYFINGCDILLSSFINDAITFLDDNTDKNIFIRNCKTYENFKLSNFYSAFERNLIGPYLSMCVFRKKCIDILFKNETAHDIIFTGKLVYLNTSYYFDYDNYNSFIQNSNFKLNDNSEHQHDWLNYSIKQIQSYTKKFKQFNVSYHVMDKCNKNCIACGHFSPLVSDNDEGVDTITFEEDLKSILYLKQYINEFILTGGEPTLHKNLVELITIAKKYFDNIRLCSNGLNIDFFKNNKDFLIENDVDIFITNYNINLYNKIHDMLGDKCRRYYILNNENNLGERIYFNSKVLSSKKVNTNKEYNCDRGECVQLKNKKLYICQYSANLEFLIGYFNNVQFPFDERGTYINTEGSNAEQVLDFLYNSWPKLCEYCNEPYISHNVIDTRVKLTTSKKELSEFYDE